MNTTQILFSGRVQGVWFRATTKRLAGSLPLSGYVRNLPDGRVELIVQGTDSDIESLLQKIRAEYPDNIEDIERRCTDLEELNGFEVCH